MNKILPKTKFYAFILLFFAYVGNASAQCSITATTNASTLSCGTSPLSSCGGILYIGNGTNAMSLSMNQNLDLTCLGAIQLIVRNNATLDFYAGSNGNNFDLKLAAGSSIVFQTGSAIYSGGGCSASDRIYIGGSVVANCNGSSVPSFDQIVTNGGINEAGILSGNQYICTYGTTTTTFSSTSSGGTWSSSNTSIATVNSSSGVVTAVGAGTATITYTRSGATATRTIYVANGLSPDAVVTGSTTQCQSTATNYTASSVSGASSYTWSYSGSGATITPATNGLSATISFSSTATSGNLKVTTTNACGSVGGGNELWITINPIITGVPVVGSASNQQCYYAQLNWTTVSNATGYYLDIATDSGFTNFVAGYNNFYVSGNNSSYGANNLPAGTLYYRVRGYNSCTTTANSGTASFSTTSPLGGSVSSPQTICSGTSPTSNLTLSGNTTPSSTITKWQRATDIGFTTNLANIAETTNILSIAKIGVLTVNTYFRAVVEITSIGCVSYSTPVLITVNNSVSAASSSPTSCINAVMTTITHTTSGFTGISNNGVSGANGLPAGVSATFASNTVTVSGTPTTSGIFNYSIPLTGGSCGSVTATGTITVTAANTAGTASSTPTLCVNTVLTAITHSTTGATGIGTAIGLPAGVTAAWASNTITISGTPTASGTYNYTIPLTGGCGSVNATGTITVTAANTAGTASSTPMLCVNTALTAITHSTTGATGIGTTIGLPAGVTAAWASNTITISGTPTASGAFNYTIPLTGGCGSVNATGTITVTAANTSGTASSTPTLCVNTALTAITHSTTGATGIGTAIGLPAGVTAAWASNTITISGTPTASGAFNYTIPLTGGCGSVNATGTITVTAANTAGTASSTPTLCVNTALTAITHSTTGATGIGTAIGLPAGVTAAWASNTITISGTPTVSGAFNYTIPLTGGCGTVNATGTITVTAANTVGTASSTPTLCVNTALTAITHSTTGATGIGTATGLPTGVTAAWASNAITISGTPTASGTFNYTIPLTGGCGSVNATGTITVTATNTAGTASSTPTLCVNTALTAITHSTTGATGIGTATGLPAGVTASWASNTITISGTPTASGSFNYTIPLTGGCGSVNATGTITVTAANTVGTASSTPTLCVNTALTAITHSTTGATGIGTATGLPAGVTAAFASNTITISGTPTASGLFNYTIPLTGGCGSVNATGTITVTAANTVGTASSTPTLCVNTALTAITHSTTGATGIGTAIGLPAGVTASWASNTITISGTPTASGTFNYTIPLTGGCGSVNATGTITVIALLSSMPSGISVNGSAPGAINTYCASTSAVFSIVAVANASSYTWSLPTGWTLVSGQGTTSVTVITGTSSQSGNVSVYASNLCGNTSAISQWIGLSTIPPTAPTIVLVRPDCTTPTGGVTVTKPTPSAGTIYTITGTNPVVAAISNSTGVFAGLTVGDYSVTYQVGLGCVSSGQTVSIQATNTNTWDGTKWSKTGDATPPTAGDVVVFNGNYSSNTDIQGCSCQVNPGFTVTIPSGKTMTITNGVSNGGTLIFEDGASLVQYNDAAINTGKITYKRIASPMKNFDFTYWSSPVKDQVLNVLSPNTLYDKYFSYASSGWVTENGTNTMNPAGKGFIIRVPKPNSTYPNGKDNWITTTYSQPVEFVGVPYNGNITIPTQGAGQFNLIGNPYPSAIDADAFLEDSNNRSVEVGTLYFWTHNTGITQSGSQYIYSSDDYAYYNVTGGTAAIAPPNPPTGIDPEPLGYIAACQSFFVGSKAAGNFEFTNSMRVFGSNSQFFKMSNTKKTTKIEKNRVWLNLTNSGGAFKQILVGYITGASNDLDDMYDGVSINGNTYVDFYSVNSDKNLTIQGRALPFNQSDEVPLGYKTSIEGTFDISINNADGILANQTVYLEDKVTNVLHNLKDGAYTFTTLKGEFKDRFVLRYTDGTKLGTSDFNAQGKSVIVSVKNHQIKVNSFDETIAAVMVYDLKGSLLYENKKIDKNEFIVQNLSSSDQFLIVLTQLANGKWVTQEVIF